MSDFRLKVFQSVAKNLSFTKASQELFVSQPAITKHIQELETCYQTRLFDRQGNKISLTEAGKLLLEHSERILDAYKRLEYEMHLLHGDYIGELKLGASTTIAQYVLPPLLGNFIRKFPQVNLSLLNGNSRGIEAALQEHRIDLGLVEGIFRLPNLKYTTFLEDELVAVVHNQSKLSLPDEITPEDLPGIPLVLRERGSGTLDVFERTLLQHNIKLSSLNVLMYLGSTESIKLFLENTDCMGIVSVRSIYKELAAGTFRVIEIRGMQMLREFCFVHQQGQEGGLSQVFMQFAMHPARICNHSFVLCFIYTRCAPRPEVSIPESGSLAHCFSSLVAVVRSSPVSFWYSRTVKYGCSSRYFIARSSRCSGVYFSEERLDFQFALSK